jgi:hypothetical protein
MDLKRAMLSMAMCVFVLLAVGCHRVSTTAEPEMKAAAPAAAPAESPKAAAPAQIAQTGGTATIHFEDVMHDFGEIGPGTTQLCEFKFSNTGSATLRITDVTKTCGCTPFTLEKTEYAPGESGALKVSYHSDATPGTTTRYLFMTTNDPQNERVSLMIKAKIVEKVEYQPKSLNLTFKDGGVECPDITLASSDQQRFAITGFMASGECFSADVNSSESATRFVIKPKVDVDKLKRDGKGLITITLNHPECGRIAIPFRGIAKVLKEQKIDDYRYKFEVEMTPPAAENNVRTFMDTLYVNIKGGEKLTVQCRGFYARTAVQSK